MNKILEVKDIHFQYDKEGDVKQLDGVYFALEKGEWVSIIGKNGSGKSTTARMIDGLLEASSGSILIDGQELTVDNVWELRKKIGMVFQNPDNQFVGATVEDDVAFGMENQGVPREEMMERVDDALKQVNMLDFKKKEPARLSGGQKQRVAIAGIIALRPEIIILDEATSMLDPTGRSEIMAVIHEIKDKYKLTVLSITHDLEEAASSDRVLVMSQGKIMRDARPEALFASGDDMIEMGLDVPFSSNLMQDLDMTEEGYLTEEALIEKLLGKLK
ncbi:energy-coupling factor ABC transporter ATP-binding protein [Lactococcus termiticola]|uniref:Energy-coupling factor transporter ATP-binding protein n=1 Tax=Lactococcus termiticola TaxID=2169526 RepID=A0A2R5HFM5_9LACT|nr:energy-coupling factor ABC transporter ATP-binding protein [Lactococcus termiticola]GBG96802.1 energy-coupling factor transporter ATP-binding protein [Lactococcus termiticola]